MAVAAPFTLMAQSLPPATSTTTVRKVQKRGPRDTPETILGERLFLETRFAQYFAAHCNGDVNRPLAEGDPAVARIQNPRAGAHVTYPSPFGKSINCRNCHFVDEFTSFVAGMNRTYSDFLPRTPIPERGDGRTVTERNSRNMVDDYTPRRSQMLLHGDGEFLTAESLVKSTLTGRDFGWLPTEYDEAIRHVAKVIREDDGKDTLGQQYGGSYAKLMLAAASDIPAQARLASDYRLDVTTATDRQIVDEVSRLIGAYLRSLQLEQTPKGIHSGSAYDMFLAKNNLPPMPAPGESDVQYSQRLLQQVEQLQNPRFVLPYERWLRFHPHVLAFGKLELEGLKIFLRQGSAPAQQVAASHAASNGDLTRNPNRVSPFFLLAGLPLFGVLLGRAGGRRKFASDWMIAAILSLFVCFALAALPSAGHAAQQSSTPQQPAQQGPAPQGSARLIQVSSAAKPTSAAGAPAGSGAIAHTGNCVSCHPAPDFTDVSFHNTGATQEEFDAVHGAGSFARLAVPSLHERNRHPDRYVVATPSHPRASNIFRAVPVATNPLATDLGMWNIFANPDFPEVQSEMRRLLCDKGPCDPKVELPHTIARFRTPSLRDLGHSWPYLHNGSKPTVEDVIHFYVRVSALAAGGQLRNADPEIGKISLDDQDIAALAAFLRSLDEDYDN
jgi:mono/diheme cytochrome c family protein